MNNTLGPEGPVLSALVFGERWRNFFAEVCIQRDLKHAIPHAANHVYRPGQKVLVWRKRVFDTHTAEGAGPFKILRMDE